MGVYDILGMPLGVAYDITDESLSGVYDINANYIPFSSHVIPKALDYTRYTESLLFSYNGDNFDACTAYNGIIVQIMANDKLFLFDMSTGDLIIGNLQITAGHGNTVFFSKEKVNASDEFPLLYACPSSNPAKVYVNRISRLTTELVKTLSFPLEKTGYYANPAYDEENHFMYMIGYSENTYSSDDGGNNKTIVTKWDMTNLTDNGDGTFTPSFINSYERPFIYVMQGLAFFDGYVWVASGWWDGKFSYVYAMNPSDGTIDYTIVTSTKEEIEGLAWVYDSEVNKYWMLINQQYHTGTRRVAFSKIEFLEANQSN